MNLAEKLIYLRKKQGLTQLELAEKLDVSRQAVSRWEVGAAVPGTDNLKVLSSLYGVSLDYLLDDNTKETKGNVNEQQLNPSKQEETKKEPKYKNFVVCIAATLIVVTIIFFALEKHNEQNDVPALPMENMTIEEKENDSTVIFPVE